MSYRDVRDYLFVSGDATNAITGQINSACVEISKLAEKRILETEPDALARYFIEKYDVEIPVLVREGIVATHHERQVEVYFQWDREMRSVPGEAYDFEVPFEGEADIFKLRPNSFDLSPPQAVVRQQVLTFTIADRQLTPEAVKAELDSRLASIEKYLESHRRQWRGLDSNCLPRLWLRLPRGVKSSLSKKTMLRSFQAWVFGSRKSQEMPAVTFLLQLSKRLRPSCLL
ncbi:hypothetical protein C4K08_5384 [Pseudomonas chlororaphis subsp. aureofaciens]|nr:hypothetical protein C4K08_5384 [Pseudomonas chlororaphis subsp. aureofaciens]